MMTQSKPPEPPRAAAGLSDRSDAHGETIESARILQGRTSVTIEHRGTRYRLQETKAGKLILTK